MCIHCLTFLHRQKVISNCGRTIRNGAEPGPTLWYRTVICPNSTPVNTIYEVTKAVQTKARLLHELRHGWWELGRWDPRSTCASRRIFTQDRVGDLWGTDYHEDLGDTDLLDPDARYPSPFSGDTDADDADDEHSDDDDDDDGDDDDDCGCELCIMKKANQDSVEILFEISKQIPEGQYIKLMKNLRTIFDTTKTVTDKFRVNQVKYELLERKGASLAKYADIATQHVKQLGQTIDSCRVALTMSKGKLKQTRVANVLANPDRYLLSEDEDGWEFGQKADVMCELRRRSPDDLVRISG